MSRRFSTPALLLRAYEAHQHARQRLRKLTEEAEAEQEALDREMRPFLRQIPRGVRHHESVFTLDADRIVVRPAPVDSFDLDSWADVEEWGQPANDDSPIGPGPDAPSYTVPLDTHPLDTGFVSAAAVGVIDDEGGV